MAVTTIPADDGSLGVFIAGGQRLVLGATAVPLCLEPDAFDRTRMSLSIEELDGDARPLDESTCLAAAPLAGLLRFQNDDLVTRATSSDRWRRRWPTASMSSSLWAWTWARRRRRVRRSSRWAHRRRWRRTPTRVMASAISRRRFRMAVDDASQLVASEYSLENDGSSWQLTRLSDGLARTINSGDVIDGLTINLGTPAPAATDRFLLQPLTRVAQVDEPCARRSARNRCGFTRHGCGGQCEHGHGRVASLKVVDASVNPQLTTSTSTSTTTPATTPGSCATATPTHSLSSGSATWTAGQPITLNGVEIELAGVPRSGDASRSRKRRSPRSNNGNALALAGLRDRQLVGAVPRRQRRSHARHDFTDAWATAMADVGVRVQGSFMAADLSGQTPRRRRKH